MSEYEHFKGKLTTTGKSIDEFMQDVEIPNYYDCKTEYFNEEMTDQAIEVDGIVFTVDRSYYEDDSDIFESTKNEDGTIDFQVKYYNGGCGFGEALEDALKLIK